MRRSSTENSIQDGDSNTQIGHNSGTITVGYTVQEHEAALERALAYKTIDLERAHGAERQLLQSELDAIKAKLADLAEDHKARLKELEDAKRLLARHDNQLDSEKRDAAYRALDAGETTLARALLQELAKQARARRDDATKEEAEFEFELGKLAEVEVRWADAAAHYARAAQLAPDFTRLKKAREFAWRAGDFNAASIFGEDLLAVAKGGDSQTDLATALNGHGLTLWNLGRYAEAEALYRQALEIDRATLGEGHPEYATHLNNLALVLKAQGRVTEAEKLYRQALEIGRATIGEGHPDYAIRLNNLALVLQAQGQYAEAEELYEQALEIDRATIGEAHPSYATHLNNLALALGGQGRSAEAEKHFRQALEIDRATLGEAHPDYAMRLNNLAGAVQAQGRVTEAEELYAEALTILEATLPADHPNIEIVLSNLESLRAAKD